MNQLTLTNVNQLVDYTHINQYISISYLNENANQQYFGHFNESTGLSKDDVHIEVLDVESVFTSKNEDGITNFVMTSNAPMRISGSEPIPFNGTFKLTLAFSEITEDMRFDVITLGENTLLVLYKKYVPKRTNNTIP